MSRSYLMGAASAAAFACAVTSAHAQVPTTITGGGSTLALYDYTTEFTTYNNASPAAIFSNVNPNGGTVLYWPAGSGTGQLSFLNNDNTCNSSRVLTGTTTCSGNTGGANSVDYGASDATLSSTQISSWSTLPYGQAVSGNLIQLPSMGVGVSFPIVNPGYSKNGAAALNDNDLCNIFTGGFTNWNQTSAASKLAANPITVVFRLDGSGTSFLLLNHLSAVCTAPAGVTLTPGTNFVGIFPKSPTGIYNTPVVVSGVTYYSPSNFVPQTGSGGIANYLSGTGGIAAPTSAIAYLTPDFTTIDPNSNARLANGAKSALVVAGVVNGTNGVAYTPTVKSVVAGLNSAALGQNLTPPTGSNLSNPSAYVPLIQTTKVGYSVVGYTTFDLAQCYMNSTTVGSSIVTFLNDHYNNAAYKVIQSNNGFAALATTKAVGFLTVIKSNILSNASKNNLDIDDKVACNAIGR